MSGATTSVDGPVQTAGPSTTSNKNHLAIIVVGCVGGLLVVVTVILVLVPLARRRASRRQPKHTKSLSSSGGTSSTTHSRREVQNSAISADASVPLLEPDPNTNTEYSRFGSTRAQSDTATGTPSSAPRSTTTTTDTLPFPRRFAPAFRSFSARSPSPDLEPGLSRSYLSPPQPPLRHARTRIARVPMDPLPEDSVTDGSPQRGPSPTAMGTESQAAPAPTSWLHIPKASNIPLIGAFRGSISSLTSAASSSLPTMQHYPSFTKNARSATASASASSTRSSQTFYSVASNGHHAPNLGNHHVGSPPPPLPPLPPLPSEHGELGQPPPPPPPGSAARLKPGGVGERIPQVYMGPSNGLHPSRQASMVYSHKSSMLSVPGAQRSGERDRPLSGTVASGSSSLSFYADARSQLGTGEEGRWNGSVGGSSSGARGRES